MQNNPVSEAEQRTVARVAGAVAHELNNPLQGILSLLTVTLRDCQVDERCQLRLEQIHRGVSRLSRTVETLATVYENLPRPPDHLPSADLLDRFAFELSEREFAPQMLPTDTLLMPVICYAAEISKLAGDALAEQLNGHNVVQLSALHIPPGIEICCELTSHAAAHDEWMPVDQIRGVSGVAVLLDEVIKLGAGSVEFRMGDARLDGIRMLLRTA